MTETFVEMAEFTDYPEWVRSFQKEVFLGLPQREARDWHVQFARRCEQITDWTLEFNRLMVVILLIALPHDSSGVVQPVIDLHRRALAGGDVMPEEWDSARIAAWDAAMGGVWPANAAELTAVWYLADAAWNAAHVLSSRNEEDVDAARDAAWRHIRDAFLQPEVPA